MALVLVLLWGAAPPGGHAQPAGPLSTDTLSVDARLFLHLYRAHLPALDVFLRGVDASAYPAFVGGPLAAWAGALGGGPPARTAAYRLSLSMGATAGIVLGLKRLVGRRRPYATLPGVRARTGRHRRGTGVSDPYAFPSGHAALAFALATSWSLSYPRWYVVAPGLVWATGVAVSRVRFGVHYPSDVLAGAVLGAGVAVAVHLFRDTLTPAFLEDAGPPPGPMLHLRIGF